MKKVFLSIIAIVVLFVIGDFVWNRMSYDDALKKISNIEGVETCRSIPSHTYDTFLIFNPSNYQTYFFRSECFQKLAIRNRDEGLCDQVKERKAIFLDGSGISRHTCLTAVRSKASQDVSERVKPESIHKIMNLVVTSTPAGDFTVAVTPVGTLWGTYLFSVSLLDTSGNLIDTLYSVETPLSNRNDQLSTTIYRQKVHGADGAIVQVGQAYMFRASLKLIRDDAGQLQRSNISSSQLESSTDQVVTF